MSGGFISFEDVLKYKGNLVILHSMEGPYCSNRLRPVVSKSVVINVCPACKGIWFDSDTFADFIKRLSQNKEIVPQTVELFW